MNKFRIVEETTGTTSVFWPQIRRFYIWFNITLNPVFNKEEAITRIKSYGFKSKRIVHGFIDQKEIYSEKCRKRFCERPAIEKGKCQTHLDADWGF